MDAYQAPTIPSDTISHEWFRRLVYRRLLALSQGQSSLTRAVYAIRIRSLAPSSARYQPFDQSGDQPSGLPADQGVPLLLSPGDRGSNFEPLLSLKVTEGALAAR
ncbi:hypothetical protein PR003_g30082 [Phytophthora rubi]|uniref:Uncharacterized protein n=1 Tax=Phytophthora rubi TaxID=129364 RepID=A0A6A4BGI1_9STRA|nr:hypothetical protein PR003_g30082 [Phytophthora rubi]